MATKVPLVMYDGVKKELQSGDTIVSFGLWDVDGNGDLTPSSTVRSDSYWTIDGNGDLVSL